MKQRGASAVAVPVGGNGANVPLAQLPPVFLVRVMRAQPVRAERPMADAKRRLLPPGTYRITANIVIEAEFTEEQLGELIVREDGLVEDTPPMPAPEEDPWKRELAARVRALTEAYRAHLGEPAEQLGPALGSWLPQFGEQAIRDAILETAAAAVVGRQQRYEYLRALLRQKRSERRRRERT